MTTRDIPGPSIEKALKIWKDNELYTDGVIVEIGCMRAPLTHPIDNRSRCDTCFDGHSTAIFASTKFEFHSCDISKENINTAIASLDQWFPEWRSMRDGDLYRTDGVEFLRYFRKNITFLYLDAWDANLPDSAEQHLKAFKAAENKMAFKSILLIDDTDVIYNEKEKGFDWSNGRQGKGELVIPYAEAIGYRVLWDGRQTCLARGIDP